MSTSEHLPPQASAGYTDRRTGQPRFGVKRKLWRMDDEHASHADQAFASTRDRVLARDHFTCRFCAFKAGKYQEVHHVDDDHQNNVDSNLLTICTLCHNVHHLGLTGMRACGFMSYLPEVTQTEVNHIARAHHVSSKMSDLSTRDRLTGLFALFRARADSLKHIFKIDLSDPLHFAEVLSLCPDEAYARRQVLMDGLRLVATAGAFHPGQLDYYAGSQRSTFSAESWIAFTRRLTS